MNNSAKLKIIMHMTGTSMVLLEVGNGKPVRNNPLCYQNCVIVRFVWYLTDPSKHLVSVSASQHDMEDITRLLAHRERTSAYSSISDIGTFPYLTHETSHLSIHQLDI